MFRLICKIVFKVFYFLFKPMTRPKNMCRLEFDHIIGINRYKTECNCEVCNEEYSKD